MSTITLFSSISARDPRSAPCSARCSQTPPPAPDAASDAARRPRLQHRAIRAQDCRAARQCRRAPPAACHSRESLPHSSSARPCSSRQSSSRSPSAHRLHQRRAHQRPNHRRQPARIIKVLHQEAARRLISTIVGTSRPDCPSPPASAAHPPAPQRQADESPHWSIRRPRRSRESHFQMPRASGSSRAQILVHHLHNAPARHRAPAPPAANPPPESPHSPAAPAPAPPPYRPSSTRCPLSCSGPAERDMQLSASMNSACAHGRRPSLPR